METSRLDLTKEDNSIIIHHIDHVRLYDYGYEKSGSLKGDPDLFVSYLQQILNGDLVEESYKGFTDDEKKERITWIKNLEKKLIIIRHDNAQLEVEIKEKERSIDKYRNDLLNLHELRSESPGELKTESFSIMKFVLNAFILSVLSIYLFFFYISATYKALYVDFETTAERIARGEGTGSIMPGPYELADALHYNYLLLAVPFVFYAFGWAFHIFLELPGKRKFFFLSLLIVLTFTVDFLLAIIISNNTENAKALMGLPMVLWYQNPSFYIILFLGFLVYIVWSVLLDSLLREWDKKEVTNNLKKIIKHLQGDCKFLASRLHETTSIHAEIANYREDVSIVMQGNLKRYIDQFSAGWIAYLKPENLKIVKERCLVLKKEFEERNGIRSGMVKVVSKHS